MNYRVGYSATRIGEPSEWTDVDAQDPAQAAREFVDGIIKNGECGHGDVFRIFVRDCGVWRFEIETVVRVAKTEKIR